MATMRCASEAADIPVAHPWRRNSASWLMAPQRADGAPLSLPGRRQSEPRGVSTVVYIATHAAQLGGWALQARCHHRASRTALKRRAQPALACMDQRYARCATRPKGRARCERHSRRMVDGPKSCPNLAQIAAATGRPPNGDVPPTAWLHNSAACPGWLQRAVLPSSIVNKPGLGTWRHR